MTPTILIADDDDRARMVLEKYLKEDGYAIVHASDGLETLKKLQDDRIDLLLLDLKMPNPDGMTILRTLASRNHMPVIVLTCYGTIQAAVEATKLGAYDFLEKPLQVDRIRLAIKRALDHTRLQREHAQLVSELRAQHKLIGNSSSMRQIRELIAKVAALPVTVLIQGESGTGKELVARAIHAASPRAGNPCIVVNCAAIPDNLIESELFGHARGAFTGATHHHVGKIQLADHGTVLLDEIGDMSLAAQSKILRVLETGEIEPIGQEYSTKVSVRVLAATHKDLIAEIKASRFRDDLYHRLNVITIQIPPLRDRREDIPDLVTHIISEFCAEHKFPLKILTPEALRLLIERDWPGNVRELKHAIHKLLILTDDTEITGKDVKSILDGIEDSTSTTRVNLRQARKQFERKLILSSLIAHRWNVEATARDLGLQYTYLYRKMKALDIEPADRLLL